MDILWSLAAVAILVAANGFFVAAEFAFVTVRKTRIDQLVAEGHGSARAVQSALNHLDRYVAGTQVGITIASLALGWVGEPAVAKLLLPALGKYAPVLTESQTHAISVGVGFSIVTFLHVILGELVPKSLALQKPELTALAVARPMKIVAFLFQPLIWSLNGIGNRLLELLGLHSASGHETAVHSARELEMLVGQSHRAGELDDLERRMIEKSFSFSETAVSDVMVQRAELTGLDLQQPIERLLDIAAEAQHTRLPVYDGTLDQVVGIVYLFDLFRLVHQGVQPIDIKRVLRPAIFVPETLHLDDLLERFRKHSMHMAIVVDEHGGTAGGVTLEDVFERVFGEVHDQNEDHTPQIVRGPSGVLSVRGDTRLEELREILGAGLVDEDADTVAGYVMGRLGRVPKAGDLVETPVGRMLVKVMERQRIVEIVIDPKVKLPTSTQM